MPRTAKRQPPKSVIDPNQLPPQNIEAEQSVLGAILIDKDAITKIADILEPNDFYRKAHANIFEAMLELYSQREPIDLLSLSSRLKEKKQLQEIGNISYLTTLVNSVPSASHIIHYAKIVNQKRVLRDLIGAAHEIHALGYEETENIENLLDEAEKKIFSISQKSLIEEFLPIKDHLNEAFERIDRRQKGSAKGIQTGFIDLDNILAGLQKSDLIILAARPSLGKTSLALDIARYAAINEKVPVGIFSIEMSREQVVDRILAAEAQIDLWRLRTGKLSEDPDSDDFTKIRDCLARLSQTPIYIDDAAMPTVLQIRTKARRLQAEHGLGLLIIDYLQLMETTNTSRADSRTQEVSEISRSLKSLARELNIPIIAISQLSRAPETRPDQVPRLSDLRESGAIEQDADAVLFIWREDKVKKDTERRNIAEIHIAKHRNGPTGKVELYFNENYVSFKNLDKLH